MKSKPARTPSNSGRRANIGLFSSFKMNDNFWYESHLERDYMYLLEIDPNVISYRSQPFKIKYLVQGKKRTYTPDLFVELATEKHVAEVKPVSKVNSERNQEIFRHVAPQCKEQGWKFVVVTDQMIRVQPKLNNVKLLYTYSKVSLSFKDYIDLEKQFQKKETASLEEVGRDLASQDIDRTKLLRALYYGILETDLMQPISSNSLLTFSQVPFDKERFKIS